MNGNNNFLLDTNIVVGFLNGHPAISHYFQNNLVEKKIFVSQITRMELLGFPQINEEEEKVIKQFLQFTAILPIDDSIVEKTIALRRTTRLKLPDAIIAATSIVNGLSLVTCDEHFSKNIPGLVSLIPTS